MVIQDFSKTNKLKDKDLFFLSIYKILESTQIPKRNRACNCGSQRELGCTLQEQGKKTKHKYGTGTTCNIKISIFW